MKYYVVDNKKDTIYVGLISQSSEGKTYDHSIKSYFIKEADGNFKEYPTNDSHIDFFVTKAYNKGMVKEFPSLESAKAHLGK